MEGEKKMSATIVTAKQKSEYYYIKGVLECEGNEYGSLKCTILEPVKLKSIIVKALGQLHGSVGASMAVDTLKCDKTNGEFILRVKASDLTKLWSSLSLFKSYDNIPCVFRIKQVSAYLMSLAADSRTWSLIDQAR